MARFSSSCRETIPCGDETVVTADFCGPDVATAVANPVTPAREKFTTPVARSAKCSSGPELNDIMRSRQFISSLMLPGQSYCIIACVASYDSMKRLLICEPAC